MIDFHSHILPGIDDGAENIEASFELLKTELKQGFSDIVLTPHFYPDYMDYNCFLQRRAAAYSLLSSGAGEHGFDDLKLYSGAEIRISPKLFELDCKSLCVEGTNLLLLEFPDYMIPPYADDLFSDLTARGFKIILVHAERYSFNNNSNYLYYLVRKGILIQVNIGSCLNKGKKKVFELMEHKLVHLLGSDTHSMDKRPPRWDSGLSVLNKKFGSDYTAGLMSNAGALLKGEDLILPEPIKFTKRFVFKLFN